MMSNERRGEEGILPMIGQGRDQSGQPQSGQPQPPPEQPSGNPYPPVPEDVEILNVPSDLYVLRVGSKLAVFMSVEREIFDDLPVKPTHSTPSLRGDKVGSLAIM